MEERLTASNLTSFIKGLPKNIWLDYIHAASKNQVRIVEIIGSEGPIRIERRDSKNGESKLQTISTQMLWRVANSINIGVPVNLDRILGASYNTRSALETLLAHTPQFFWCRPGRIEITNNSSKIKDGHKHIIWLPKAPHQNGVLTESKLSSDMAISELPSHKITYEALVIPSSNSRSELDIKVERRHLQIQIALLEIGRMIGYKTWIAHNDKGLKYGNTKIGELDGVVASLSDLQQIASYQTAITAAKQIDCIWFKNGRLIPAVMEVEHSTGIKSGLTRMKNFFDLGPPLKDMRWVIVAPDEDRSEVIRKSSEEQFKPLNTKFFPYSAVEELYSICKRRRITKDAINENFLDCFMEKCFET